MACRGVLFAVPHETAEALRAASDDDEVRSLVEEIEDAWEEPFVAETDKAWDAMHRALSDGTQIEVSPRDPNAMDELLLLEVGLRPTGARVGELDARRRGRT